MTSQYQVTGYLNSELFLWSWIQKKGKMLRNLETCDNYFNLFILFPKPIEILMLRKKK